MNWKPIVSAIREQKHEEIKTYWEFLELYAPRKLIVEPAEHHKLDTGIKIDLSEDFTKTFSAISEKIKPQNWKKRLNQKV